MPQTKQREVTRPAHTVRYGSLKGTIWKNDTKNGPMYNVVLIRSYKDGDEWKDSNGFGFDDLLLLAKIADECHTWIAHQMRGPGNDSSN